MRTINPEKEEQSKNEIITTAQKLFQTYGLDKTSMEDIANALGKGKSTLYYYFKSKDEVFHAVARKEMAAMLEVMKDSVSGIQSASAKLRALFLCRSRELRLKLNLYAAVLPAERRKHYDLFKGIRRETNEAEMLMLKQIFSEGIKKGEFKSISVRDCGRVVRAAVAVMNGVEAEIFLSGEMPPDDIQLNTITDIFIRGLR